MKFNLTVVMILIIALCFEVGAKTFHIRLSELVMSANLIALGEVRRLKESKGEVYVLQIERRFKTNTTDDLRVVDLCSSESADGPAYDDGWRVIVFLKKSNSCYDAINGYRGTVRIEQGKALTVAIDGEPETQTETEFISAVNEHLRRSKRYRRQ